jgi:Tol biopolymer transport system component
MLKSERLRATTIAAAFLIALVAVVVLWGARPAEAAFPGANGKIAFSSNRTTGTGVDNPTGDHEIFAMNPDRTGLEQLTDNTAGDVEPTWSANGGWIAWASFQDGNYEIYMWNYARSSLPVPNQPKRLTTNTAPDFGPSFNHDGTKIAFESFRDGNYEIYVMDTADTNPADGNGDDPTNLTNNTASDFKPAFNHDGTKIAYTSILAGSQEVIVMDADGTHPVNLTNNDAANDSEPAWSPDGTKIAFTSFRDGNTDIYVMNADGTDQRRLTKNTAHDSDPAFSPDGKKIAFTSYRGGESEIYVMKAKPESRKNRPKNLTKNDVEDVDPDWRPIPQP